MTTLAFMDFDAGLLVPLGVFAMVFGIVYVSLKNKERMAIIERGEDVPDVKPSDNRLAVLKYALLLIGIAAGFVVGDVVANLNIMNEGVAYFAMIFLFAGISLLIYLMAARWMSEND